MGDYAIGVDLGGTNLRVAAVDEDGTMLVKTRAADRGFAGAGRGDRRAVPRRASR